MTRFARTCRRSKVISGDDSKHIYHLGTNSISYVEAAEACADSRPDILAANFDKEAFEKRFKLTQQYQRVSDAIDALLSDVNGTNDTEGGKVMADAGDVYDSAKRALKKDPSLQTQVDRMAERFAKTRAAKPAAKTQSKPAV